MNLSEYIINDIKPLHNNDKIGDIQVLFNPALSPDKSAIALFGIRSRINF